MIDLARIYATLGQDNKAYRAIHIATSLYPNHRFIIRSAVRFFVQVDEVERALRLVNSSPRTPNDPWLLATKLSVEQILGREHKQLRRARALTDSNKFNSFQLSELRSTIASIQLAKGENKLAKKYFCNALICPNDNVVAQAIWSSQNYNISIEIRNELMSGPLTSEAVFYQTNKEGNFLGAKEAAFLWLLDEPFSPRPFKAASFVAGILGEGELSEKYALSGLKLDKNDIELRNNLVFALAIQNKLEDAIRLFDQTTHLERKQLRELGGHTMANCGMILYRLGYLQQAEECYRKAIEIFDKKKLDESKGIAIAFMAREAISAKSPNAKKIVQEAKEIVAKVKSRAGGKVLSLIDESAKTNETTNPKYLELNKKWIYDKENNFFLAK